MSSSTGGSTQQAATTASTSYSPSSSSSQPATTSSAYVGQPPPPPLAAAAAGGGGEHVSRVSSSSSSSRLSATHDYANNRSADKSSSSSSSSPALRRWSRNLSEQRHRELDRLNQIERRRQFLELKRQNDLFDQMSTPSTSVVSRGQTTVVVQNQKEGQQPAASSSAVNSSLSADETKTATLSENQVAANLKSGQQLSASKEASPLSVIAERNDSSDKPAAAAATASIGNGFLDCDPVAGKTVVTCPAERSLTWSSASVEQADERAHKGKANNYNNNSNNSNSERALAHTKQAATTTGKLQPESGGQQPTALQVGRSTTDNECAKFENPIDKAQPNGVDLIQQQEQAFLAHQRRPISTEQLAQFVNTRVPENKRAIVDIDDSYQYGYGSCGYGGSNGECSLLGTRGSDGEDGQSGSSSSRLQLAAAAAADSASVVAAAGESRSASRAETNAASGAASADNSFSASSSISADMLFIGGGGNNNINISGCAQGVGDNFNLNGLGCNSSSQAAICHSPPAGLIPPGTSYSDNEVYADTETEEGASSTALDVCDKKGKKVVKRGSLLMMAGNSLRGRDSPLVFPNNNNNNNNKRDINTQCSTAAAATNYDAGEVGGLIDSKKKALVYPPLNQSSGGDDDDKSKHSSGGGTSKSATPGRGGRRRGQQQQTKTKSLANKRPNLPSPPKGGRQKDLDVENDSDNDDGSRQKQQSRRLLNDDDDDDDDEEEEEEEDDEGDDEVGTLSRNPKSGRVANNNNNSDEEEEEDDDDDEEVDYEFQSGGTNAMVQVADQQRQLKNYCDQQLHQDLFDNDQNPYTGTYGVLLAGRRRKKKAKTYLIGPNEYGYTRKNSICKLKSNVLGTQFNAIRLNHAEANDRCTIASISYETNVLGFKGPRKMRVFLAKDPSKSVKNLPETFKKNPTAVVQLKNMTPSWNVESQSYVLNFHGRVTQASVKNFQLIECEDQLTVEGQSRQQQLLNNVGTNNNNNNNKTAYPHSTSNGRQQLLGRLPNALPGPYDLQQQQQQSPSSSQRTSRNFSSQSQASEKLSSNKAAQHNNLQLKDGFEVDRLSASERVVNSQAILNNGGGHANNIEANISTTDASALLAANKTLTYNSSIVMQFGRTSDHEFTCDGENMHLYKQHSLQGG